MTPLQGFGKINKVRKVRPTHGSDVYWVHHRDSGRVERKAKSLVYP